VSNKWGTHQVYSDSRNLFINNYGSLGQAQRETTDTGIQFMGARGYNPTTGQFLTPDPVRGGNETPYNYPNDPVANIDTSGLLGFVASVLIDIAFAIVVASAVAASCATVIGCGPAVILAASVGGAFLDDLTTSTIDNIKNSSQSFVSPSSSVRGGGFSAGIGELSDKTLKSSKMYKNNLSRVARSFVVNAVRRTTTVASSICFRYFETSERIAKSYRECRPINWFSEWVF
jgi:RHS repeat-associated protein